ncbi:MAG: hypothetical protein JRH10_21465 [Deltaproteobacteria bacterium]|nr:hypothetical protein [Deltaproteobacteria bacterium]MBW2446665.1 hypothetical protein [Deltaproteobacteria bacterium]
MRWHDPGRDGITLQFWFEAVQGHLSDREYGLQQDHAEPELTEPERNRRVTVICNSCVGETAALDGASGLVAAAPNEVLCPVCQVVIRRGPRAARRHSVRQSA